VETPAGGYLDPWADKRLIHFFEQFPNPKHVLELSCLYGDHTIELARRSACVTVVEGRERNIQVARERVAEAGLTNVAFIKANLEAGVPDVGADITFCSGLLYHLPKPWDFLQRLTTKYLYLWTHYTTDNPETVEGYEGRWWQEYGVEDPHSGLSPRSFWMTEKSLWAALEKAGYQVMARDADTGWLPSGPNLILTCERVV